MDITIKTVCREVGGYTVRYSRYEGMRRSDTDERDGPRERMSYSVSVEKINGSDEDRAYADDITADKSAALSLIGMLERNGVTPITFLDILEDEVY